MIVISQEPEVVPARPLLLWLAVTALVTALSAALAWVLSYAPQPGIRLDTGPRTLGIRSVEATPGELRGSNAAPYFAETEAERAAKNARTRLTSYGFTQRARGRIHIPLRVAEDLYLSSRRSQP